MNQHPAFSPAIFDDGDPKKSQEELDELEFALACVPVASRTDKDIEVLARNRDKLRKSSYVQHPDYTEIQRAILAERLEPRQRAALIVDWHSRRHSCPPEQVLAAIVGCFNRYGAEYTAGVFGFGQGHKFDWLPKTDKKIPTFGAEYIGAVAIDPKAILHTEEFVRNKSKTRWERYLPENFDYVRLSHENSPESIGIGDDLTSQFLQSKVVTP